MKKVYTLRTVILSLSSFLSNKVLLYSLVLVLFSTLSYGQRTKPRLMKYSFITGSKRITFSSNIVSNSFLNFSLDNNLSNNVNSFTGYNFSFGYGRILLKHRFFDFYFNYSTVGHKYYNSKSYTFNSEYGIKLFNYRSMFFLNAAFGIPFGYDHFKEFDTNKSFNYFSIAAKPSIEAELYLTNNFIAAARISPIFKVYNIQLYQFCYSYGLAVKILF